MLGESDVRQPDGRMDGRTEPLVWKSGEREEEGRRSGKHLVGHGVLVGEPLAARQVLVHGRNDLQDVVVRGQSCNRGESLFHNQADKFFSAQSPKMDVTFSPLHNWLNFFFLFLFSGHVCFLKMQRQHRVSQPLGVSTNYVVTCQQKNARRTYGWTPAGRRLPAR